MIKLSNKSRTRLLSTASATVAAVALASTVYAGETIVTAPAGAAAVNDAQDLINQLSSNQGTADTSVDTAEIGIDGVVLGGATLLVDNSDALAQAFGNNYENDLDLTAIENSINGDGGAALISAINVGNVLSSVDSTFIGIDVTGFTTGTAEVYIASITADSTGNGGSNLLSGTIPNGYESDTGGSSVITTGATWLDADGSLLASTSQVNDTSTVSANVGVTDPVAIGIVLTSAAGNTVDATPTVDTASIAASARGNRSDSTILIEAGDNPAFTGTAAVTNAQSNYSTTGTLPHAVSARNVESTILVEVDANAGANVLAGGVVVTNSSISSSASGNEALGDGVAGNRIVLDDTESFVGLATGAAVTDIAYNSLTLAQSVQADLIINSSQGNVGADNGDGRLQIGASTSDSTIGTDLQAINGASVAITENDSTATARGNTATSEFATGASINSFDGSVAVGNQQTNVYTNVSATNSVSLIGAEVAETGQAELPDSEISVADNRVAAVASGNQSSQTIDLAASSTTLPAGSVELRGGNAPDGNVYAEGGATAANLQSVYSSNVNAVQNFSGVGITTDAATVLRSALSVADNTQEAAVIGNVGNTSVALTGTTVNGGVGAVNTQVVADDFEIDAQANSSAAGAEVLAVSTSTIAVGANRQAATAYGNQGTQSVSVAGTTVTLPATGATLEGGSAPVDETPGDANVLVLANVGLANIQIIEGNDDELRPIRATAGGTDSGNLIGITADGNITNSTLAVTWTPAPDPLDPDAPPPVKNVQEAVAVGNSGTDDLSLSGNDVGTGAGLASVQLTNNLTIAATNQESAIGVTAGEVSGSTVEVSNNLQRAIAYAGTVTNTLEVSATSVEVDAAISAPASTVTYDPVAVDGYVLDGDVATNPEVAAAYALLNVQTNHVVVDAVIIETDAVGVDLEDVSGSTIINDDNAYIAAAYGADATNSASLLGDGNLSTDPVSSFASVLNVTNVQTLVSNEDYISFISSSAQPAVGTDGGVVNTFIDGNVIGSSVSTSGNLIQSQSFGNLVENDLLAELNNIDTEEEFVLGPDSYASVIDNEAETDASFTINNVQAASGRLVATTIDNYDVPVVAATVLTEVTGNLDSSTVNSDGNAISGASTANRADSALALEGNDMATSSALTNFQVSTAQVDAFVGVDGDDDPNSGGVIVDIGGDVGADGPATVTVNDNVIAGSVTGNSATSSISVTASHLADGNDHLFTFAGTDAVGTGVDSEASGDHSLANVQIVGLGIEAPAPALTSNVYGTFAINMADAEEIDDSTLEVDGNTQSSRAVANTAANSITLDVGNTEAGAALVSNQTASADVSATSNLDIYAPVASENSTVSISDNSNLAVGVINNVTNEVTVDATNASFVNTPSQGVFDVDDVDAVAYGTHVLVNTQFANTEVNASATTNLVNDDFGALSSEGISNGTVTITGNSTTAEASANRAENTMNVSGSASNTTIAGVVNNQGNTANATAQAITNAGVGLFGETPDSALENGTVQLGQNTTTSLARGNAATNALNFSAGSNYGTTNPGIAGATLDYVAPNATVDARAGVLNVQNNSGTILANSVDSSYLVALNSTTGPTVTGATVGVIGNAISAAAYGNTADNKLTMTALNTAMPTAVIGSQQVNTASVTANATGIRIGITSGVGGVTGSTLRVSGNSVTATAVGNNAVNTIIAN